MNNLSNRNLIIQIFPFALFACIDGFASVSFIWLLLDKYNSLLSIGICLSISTILSFLIQKKLAFIKNQIYMNVNKFFMFQSFFALVFSISNLFLLNNFFNREIIMISLIIYSLFVFMNYFVIDSFISKLILNKKITSTKGSVVSQIVMQFGAIIGFSVGGKVFNLFGIKGSSFSIIFLILMSLIIVSINSTLFQVSNESKLEVTNSSLNKNESLHSSFHIWMAAFCILMISFQISNFNLFLPDIFLKYKYWTAENYGYIAGITSLGAFIASFVVYKGNLFLPCILLASCVIPIANYILAFSNVMILCLVASFFLGFSVNSLRSTFRKNMFDNLSSQNDVSKWMSISNLFTFLPRALFPLIASLLIGSAMTNYVFPMIGLIIALLIIVFTILFIIKSNEIKKIQHERL
ncbi:MFS transporter [Silvanigrella aquatica]|uniref:Major facilitator superfamily (MFS) profile domain-containing protein n=1 Tax=Silvanigrella aquatica TaxID=1915309 RepID=A0A1L4CYR3_9BACT|nr:MFS transporter [Silvanigrella aquatica]APJ03077.1 hypothetical protein AXG55_03790 [Silvanigrella aquatica]